MVVVIFWRGSVVVANRIFQLFERAVVAIGKVQVLLNRRADGKRERLDHCSSVPQAHRWYVVWGLDVCRKDAEGFGHVVEFFGGHSGGVS